MTNLANGVVSHVDKKNQFAVSPTRKLGKSSNRKSELILSSDSKGNKSMDPEHVRRRASHLNTSEMANSSEIVGKAK